MILFECQLGDRVCVHLVRKNDDTESVVQFTGHIVSRQQSSFQLQCTKEDGTPDFVEVSTKNYDIVGANRLTVSPLSQL